MLSLRELSQAQAEGLRAVFTDIDGTLTDGEGRIASEVFASMERLQAAGLAVVPVTGRPAGWCDQIARTWPVDGVIGENGGLYFRREKGQLGSFAMERVYAQDEATRRRNRERLAALSEAVLEAHPGAAISSDQQYREFDLAVDFCEDVPALGREEVDAIVAQLVEAGCTVKISSIHVNAWFGRFDKSTMCLRFARDVLGVDLAGAEAERATYFGDSPNDAPLFALFPLAVGVANVRDLQDRIVPLPRFVTEREGGLGFVEGVEYILGLRADG